jgi:hypothetical protein
LSPLLFAVSSRKLRDSALRSPDLPVDRCGTNHTPVCLPCPSAPLQSMTAAASRYLQRFRHFQRLTASRTSSSESDSLTGLQLRQLPAGSRLAICAAAHLARQRTHRLAPGQRTEIRHPAATSRCQPIGGRSHRSRPPRRSEAPRPWRIAAEAATPPLGGLDGARSVPPTRAAAVGPQHRRRLCDTHGDRQCKHRRHLSARAPEGVRPAERAPPTVRSCSKRSVMPYRSRSKHIAAIASPRTTQSSDEPTTRRTVEESATPALTSEDAATEAELQ